LEWTTSLTTFRALPGAKNVIEQVYSRLPGGQKDVDAVRIDRSYFGGGVDRRMGHAWP